MAMPTDILPGQSPDCSDFDPVGDGDLCLLAKKGLGAGGGQLNTQRREPASVLEYVARTATELTDDFQATMSVSGSKVRRKGVSQM